MYADKSIYANTQGLMKTNRGTMHVRLETITYVIVMLIISLD